MMGRKGRGTGNPSLHGDYEVGYGKPPVETRFKKGLSGNPRGRPKGAKNKRPAGFEERLHEIVLDEAYREISVRDGAGMVQIPMAKAVIRSMAVKAAKGDHRSQRLFAEMLSATESLKKARHDEFLQAMIEYKADWEYELWRRDRRGITDLPDPLPHPDHILINPRQGTATVVGPMTKEEKVVWDRAQLIYQELQEDLDHYRNLHDTTENPTERANWQDRIDSTRKFIKTIEKIVGPQKI